MGSGPLIDMSKIVSFSCDDAFANLLNEAVKEAGIPRSVFLRTAVMRMVKLNPVAEQKHTASAIHRANREDGKCNPMMTPKCLVCWGDDEE
jgi:hypothetical protein